MPVGFTLKVALFPWARSWKFSRTRLLCTPRATVRRSLSIPSGQSPTTSSSTLHDLRVPRSVPGRAQMHLTPKSRGATRYLHTSPGDPHTAGRGASAPASRGGGASVAEGGADRPPPYRGTQDRSQPPPVAPRTAQCSCAPPAFIAAAEPRLPHSGAAGRIPRRCGTRCDARGLSLSISVSWRPPRRREVAQCVRDCSICSGQALPPSPASEEPGGPGVPGEPRSRLALPQVFADPRHARVLDPYSLPRWVRALAAAPARAEAAAT